MSQAAQICAAAADSMSVVSAFGKACRMSPTFRAVMKESPESMRPVLTSAPTWPSRSSSPGKATGWPGTCPRS